MNGYSSTMTVVVDEARGAVAAHVRCRAAEHTALSRRNDAIRALYDAGMTVPDIDRALDQKLSRSMIRWILGHS